MTFKILLLMMTACVSSSIFSQAVPDWRYFDLNGNVKSMEIILLKNERDKKKKLTLDTLEHAFFEFSASGDSGEKLDDIDRSFRIHSLMKLDTNKFHSTFNKDSTIEVARKVMDDTTEYEIHYRTYDHKGQLVSDSIRYGKHLEFGFSEGPIVHWFLYNENGDMIYYWFKSSHVFAIKDHSYFEYIYDENGNWTERRQYVLFNRKRMISEEEVHKDNRSLLYITQRKLTYF